MMDENGGSGWDEFAGENVIAIKPAAPDNLANIQATEDDIALAFARLCSDRFIFDHHRSAWFRWDGKRWRLDTTEYVPDLIRAFVRDVNRTRHKPLPELTREKAWRAIERTVRTDQRCARDHTAWNTDPMLLGVPDGFVDLTTGKLHSPDPQRMINMSTTVTPAPPGTEHPIWTRFLDEVTNKDRELQRYLQQRAGYWLTADTSRENFNFLHGPGENGKGTFLKTIGAIVGDYHVVAPIGMFLASKHEGHPTELARLENVRLVTAIETEKGRSWALAKLKMLTGNDRKIPARFCNQNFFEFEPRFKLCFVGNHKPRIAHVDDALIRRLDLVPFTFKPAKRDTHLKEKLVAEYPAILRWMIDGWLDSQANGVVRPNVVRAATEEYLAAENIIRIWIDDCCELGSNHKEKLSDLFAGWRTWAEARNEYVGTSRDLKESLGRIDGIKLPKRRGSGIWIFGIKLDPARSAGQDASPDEEPEFGFGERQPGEDDVDQDDDPYQRNPSLCVHCGFIIEKGELLHRWLAGCRVDLHKNCEAEWKSKYQGY
jgi:putative DNA primase/helicase